MSNGIAPFALFGALFVLTQFLQFELGYTAFRRRAGAAGRRRDRRGRPLSSGLVRTLGTKLTVVAGLFLVAAGLWQLSGATTAATYASTSRA